MKQRDFKIDTIKGIMIFLVVFVHCIGKVSAINTDTTWLKYIVRCVYPFHMPVFIFISGYFSSPENGKKAISKYLIPYLLANALFGLLGSFVNSQFSFSEADPFSPHWTLWYLLSLFFWKVFLSSVLEWKHPLLTMIILALITGIFSADYYLSLSRTIAFFPYFIGGYLVRKNNIRHELKKILSKSNAILLFVISELIVAFLAYNNVNGLAFQLCCSYETMNQSILTGILLRLFAYISGTAGIIFFFSITPEKKNYFSVLGKYSLTIYLAHSFCLRLISKFVHLNSAAPIFLLSVIITIIICVIFGNKKMSNAYNFVISGITRLLFIDNL